MQICDNSEFFELLGHYKPNIKFLEIEAVNVGIANAILSHLQIAYGEKMYGSYTYTDVSAGFYAVTEQRFKAIQAPEYAVLDITQDPILQIFEAESFEAENRG